MSKLLEIENLRVSVGSLEILRGISFDVNEAETVVLLGSNGAGKSTIANVLMGDEKYSVSGSINFAGESLLNMNPEQRSKAGIFVTMQNPVDIPGLTTSEMLRSALEFKTDKKWSMDETRELITRMAKKIGMNIWFSERELNVGFSGGEKKKNEILQMLVLGPRLAILDEVDSGLDIDATDRISKVLAEFQKETGISYLVITHNMRILKHLNINKVITISNGKNFIDGADILEDIKKNGLGSVIARKNAVLSDFKALEGHSGGKHE